MFRGHPRRNAIRSTVVWLCFGAGDSFGQAGSAVPEALRGKEITEYFHAYVEAPGSTPDAVLQADNNLEIVFACREPRGAGELNQLSAPVLSSQLLLLESWGLLSRTEGERFQTKFPIIGPPQSEELRKIARTTAIKLAGELESDVRAFGGLLAARRWEPSAFSILFSLVLDDLVWEELEQQRVIQPRKPAPEHPFWVGTIWILYPARAFVTGTNTVSEKGVALKINWSPSALPSLGILLTGEGMQSLFSAAASPSPAVSEEVRKQFQGYGIFDDVGHWRVPRLTADAKHDEVYSASRRMAERIAHLLHDAFPDKDMERLMPYSTRSDRVVIAYHEIMWDLLEEWDRSGLVPTPRVLKGEGERKNVGSLVFVIAEPPPP